VVRKSAFTKKTAEKRTFLNSVEISEELLLIRQQAAYSRQEQPLERIGCQW